MLRCSAFGGAADVRCMLLCRGTRARVQRTVADTGDRFFSPFPSAACRLSLLLTFVVLWQVAETLFFPATTPFTCPPATCISFVLLLLLAGVALCREPLPAHFLLLHVRRPRLTPYLLACFHAVSCTFSPTHRIRSSWTPGIIYYTFA